MSHMSDLLTPVEKNIIGLWAVILDCYSNGCLSASCSLLPTRYNFLLPFSKEKKLTLSPIKGDIGPHKMSIFP